MKKLFKGLLCVAMGALLLMAGIKLLGEHERGTKIVEEYCERNED